MDSRAALPYSDLIQNLKIAASRHSVVKSAVDIMREFGRIELSDYRPFSELSIVSASAIRSASKTNSNT
jgi:hypothetical protein